MNKTTLLPCPFCGGVAILDREDIFCDDCNASISIWDKLYNKKAENYTEAKTQAINTWNKRANIEYPEALRVVNQLAEEHKNGWIPCSERMPDVEKEVLIFANDNAMFVGRLMNGGFSVHDGDGWIDLKFILAWQPLPQPYKPEEKKK